MIILGSVGVISAIFTWATVDLPSDLADHLSIYQYYLLPLGAVFMLIYGIWLLRQQKEDTSVTPLPEKFDEQIDASIRLTSREYIKGNFELLAAVRPQFLIFYPMGILAGLLSPLFTADRTYFIISIVSSIILPYIFYRAYVRNFKASKVLQQELFYTFTRQHVNIKSETLSSQNAWTNIQRVIETRDFFFLFTNANVANIIPKHNLKSEADLQALRAIICSYPFPKKLKK